MPLSEEEQKILKEIEAQLNATDPALVEQVSRTTLYRHSARMIRWAALGFLGGLVLLVLTFATNVWAGVVGFGIMLGCLLIIERNAPEARQGRDGEHHRRLEGRRRDARVLRRARALLARALPSRRHLTSGGVHGRASSRDSPDARPRSSGYWARRGLVVPSGPHRPAPARTRTTSVTSSRCGSCARSSTRGCRRPGSAWRARR